MSELSFKDLLAKLVETFEDTRNQWAMRSTGLEKTFLTKDITLQDWNSLIVLLTQTEAYVRAIAPVVNGFESLGDAFVSEVEAANGEAINRVNTLVTRVETVSHQANTAANLARSAKLVNAYLNEHDQLVLEYANGSSKTIEESLKGPQGVQGEPGRGLKIDKSYETYDSMYADRGNIASGSVIMISGAKGIITDDVAQIYLRTDSGFQYLGDLSSTVQGPEGKQGPPGPIGPEGLRGTKVIVGLTDPNVSDDLRADDVYLKIKQGLPDEPSSLTVFRFDGENWWNQGHIQGLKGNPGTSPTIDVAESSIGYNVTISDINGTKTITLFHGKSDGEGGSDPRRNTLLCDAELGNLHIGEGNYQFFSTIALADTILPNTVYTVNGTQVTSDSDGDVFVNLTNEHGYSFKIQLSGSNVIVHANTEYDTYNEHSIRVTVTGPGALTCLAQAVGFYDTYTGGAQGSSIWQYPALAGLPYRTVFVHYADTVRPAVLNERGELDDFTFSTSNGDLTISIKNGNLSVECAYFTSSGADSKLSIFAETLDVGAAGGGASGGTSSGGGRVARTYYVPYYQSAYFDIPFDSTKSYIVTVEEITYGTPKRIVVIKDGYVYRECSGESLYASVYFEGSTLCISSSENSVFVTVEEVDSYEEISCFIEGTPVLLRDPVTYALYEKPIEQVLPFEYVAFWNPAKGRLDATRVLAPPIAGDAEEFDRLYFDNGTELDVYGVQFFWNVDTDTLVDWAKMEPGTRVCTKDGDIVCFVRSEHIVPEAPVKHYTLLTYRGRYIAGGIVAGDKRDLIYPRLMSPERVRYWRMLNEADQNGLIKAHQEGCRRRNWNYSRELHEAVNPYKSRKLELNATVESRKKFLLDTDHRVIKYAEGVITAEAFEPERIERANARKDINAAESELAEVDAAIVRETERVKREILSTWKPKHAGKFVGKSKAILEDS